MIVDIIIVLKKKEGRNMEDNISKDRIITFGPRKVSFPSTHLGQLVDSTCLYEEKNFDALREGLENDGYL